MIQSRKIQVLQEDIEVCREARQCDPRRCMISDAVQRAIPGALHIDSDLRYIRFSLETTQRRYFYDTPRRVQQALRSFDEGREVQPFTFTMSRGYSETRRSKTNGFRRSAKVYPRKRVRRQAPRKREFGLHAFSEGGHGQ